MRLEERIAAIVAHLVDGHDVTAGAQATVPCAADQDGGHGVILGPGSELLQHGCHHAGVQRVDGLWPVQGDDA